MRPFRRRAPEVRYTAMDRPTYPNIRRAAAMLEEEPDQIKGFLVVGVRHDNTIVIMHNARSLPFIVGMLLKQIRRNPELAMTRSEFPLDFRR